MPTSGLAMGADWALALAGPMAKARSAAGSRTSSRMERRMVAKETRRGRKGCGLRSQADVVRVGTGANLHKNPRGSPTGRDGAGAVLTSPRVQGYPCKTQEFLHE